jgi:hypothetical protein
MPRILYFCPDYPQPSGGTRCLYRHVAQLTRKGFDAHIVHAKRGFKLTWHGYDVSVLWLEDEFRISREDVMVISEGMTQIARQTKAVGCRRVMLPLSWAYIYPCLPPNEDWNSYGISQVLTPSPAIQRFVQWSMGLEATVVEEFVDTARYAYSARSKQDQIAYIARKSKHGDTLAMICQRKRGCFDPYRWVRLRDLPEQQYAAELVASRIFVATASQEGSNISALEAMSAGCIVVGFAGVGGHDYMCGAGPRQNCFLVENEDLGALGVALEGVVRQLAVDPRSLDGIVANAIATAARYGDFEKEGDSLRRYFQAL